MENWAIVGRSRGRALKGEEASEKRGWQGGLVEKKKSKKKREKGKQGKSLARELGRN